MPLQLDDFLHSFARYLVAKAAAFVPASDDRLRRHRRARSCIDGRAPEASARPDLYSTLIVYGGPELAPSTRSPSLNLQLATFAKSNKAAANRASNAVRRRVWRPMERRSQATTDSPPSRASDDSRDAGQWLLINVDWMQRPGTDRPRRSRPGRGSIANVER